MILLAMKKILGNLFFSSLSLQMSRRKKLFFGFIFVSLLEFTLTRVLFFLCFVCVFRVFFWFHFSLLLCVHYGVDGCIIIIIAGISFAPSSWLCWIVFSTLVLQPSNPAEESKREERITARKPYYTTHVNG